MGSKYHRSKKGRTHGAYREKLEARGLSRSPRMTEYPDLLRQAGRKPGREEGR